MRKILVIEDDHVISELIEEYLTLEGFKVHVLADGKEGLKEALSGNWDLLVLDVMLPGMNGFTLLQELRKTSRLPVIMLTAKADPVDLVLGLEVGADDYMTKPFNARELVARIRALARRVEVFSHEDSDDYLEAPLCVGDLKLRPQLRTVELESGMVNLSPTESRILENLLRRPGRAVSREELFSQALGRPYTPFDRSVDIYISILRKKLGPYPDGSDRIKTLRGDGYYYVAPQEGQEEH